MRGSKAAHSGLFIAGRYAAAIAIVSVAMALSLVFRISFGNPSWLLFPAAVMTSTWIGGRGPGWVAVMYSTLAVQYYIIPPFKSWIVKPRDLPFLFTFIVCEIVANRLIAWRMQTEDSLRQARDELELRVTERTAELEHANQALIAQMAEQKRTQDALQMARTELARVVRITTIGELTASIAHEVNQPLAAVVANADACVAWLGLQNPNLPEARSAADRAVQGATRASEVITRIRSLINKTPTERTPVQLNQIVQETSALVASQAARNHVTIATELAPDLPRVLGDRIQIQQVLLNLMSNAIEAMSASGERARQLTLRSQIQEGGQVRISVQDTGMGVNVETMARLFEPFFTTRTQGIGMGLPISRSIIEAHGGRLWAESQVNEGTTLLFTLPSVEGASV